MVGDWSACAGLRWVGLGCDLVGVGNLGWNGNWIGLDGLVSCACTGADWRSILVGELRRFRLEVGLEWPKKRAIGGGLVSSCCHTVGDVEWIIVTISLFKGVCLRLNGSSTVEKVVTRVTCIMLHGGWYSHLRHVRSLRRYSVVIQLMLTVLIERFAWSKVHSALVEGDWLGLGLVVVTCVCVW